MADRPDLNVGPDNDPEDDLLAAAFASYRSTATDVFTRKGSPNLFGEARRHARRRVATFGAAVVGSLGLLLGGVALATTVAQSPEQNADATGGVGQHDDDQDNQVDPGGVSVSASPNPDGDTATADRENLRNAELTLPAWPGALAASCPAGTYRFTDGVVVPVVTPTTPPTATADPSTDTSTSPTPAYTPPPIAWHILPGEAQALYADIDGVAGDELLVPVGCGDQTVHGLLALHNTESPMGFVYTGSTAADQITGVQVTAGTITLTVGDQSKLFYRWENDAFVTVPEPTTSPSQSPSGSPSESPGATTPTEPDGDPATPTPGGETTQQPGDSNTTAAT